VFDVISAIDACYAPQPDDGAWMDGVLAAVEPLAEGRGVYGIAFTRSDRGGSFEVIGQRGPIDVRPSSGAINALLRDEATYRALYQPQPAVELLSARARRLPPASASVLGGVFRELRTPEVLGVFGGEPDLNGVLVGVARARPGELPGPRTLHLLRRLSAHLTSARRLRRAERSTVEGASSGAATEAVLAPTGRVEEASGAAAAPSARDALSEAVRRIEWARGRARRADPEEAARAWRGLVAGAWTIVDQVERDGRRWLLARRNDPVREASRALTAGERAVVGYAALGHSNKYIAYLLGLAPSTVAKRLARAQAKLGAPSRGALIGLVGAATP
jgi:DNA-binding CsgD family transcriptional regulator